MTYYYQETDSKIVFALPGEVSYLIPVRPRNETVSGTFDLHFIPLPTEANLIKLALTIIRQIDNQHIAEEAKKLLLNIQNIANSFQQSGIDLSHLPPLRAFLPNDGSVLIEWIFPDFRIGFSIEPTPEDSGWYLVSNKKLGEISASGYVSGIDIKNLILWLLNFVLAHS